ncbi:19105_t:CDS:2 [Cetraspora pellucida]|uniref:19105_t:CDS:1 n=1 Tax=Cetraspora pellucida TaxID=1433469 RepID=A0A9N9G0M7_9GLOM|nr:19105_t:CDS:2 [Cetraspora pellucida]
MSTVREKVPTVNEVEGWKKTEQLINFLHKQDLGLKDKHFDILCKQEVNGISFLELTLEKLLVFPYELPGGPAEVIAKLVKKIKDEGEAMTVPNQEVQELKERLAILQASKIREEVPLYFRYLDSQVINFSSNGWNDLIQLYILLEKAFDDLRGTLDLHMFTISNQEIDISWSKKMFIDFIEIHKCSIDNPVIISDIKRGVKRSYLNMLEDLPSPSTLGNPKVWDEQQKQKDHPFCFNHHPPKASRVIPVSLYSSIFGQFKDFCKEDPEKEDNKFTYDFCCKMAEIYENEEDRQNTANEML